jgi:transcriptional regulator with XRE-family HTH domain
MSLEKISELRKIRLILGWSQLRLAKALGISQSIISYAESGLINVSPSLQKKINQFKKVRRISTELKGEEK